MSTLFFRRILRLWILPCVLHRSRVSTRKEKISRYLTFILVQRLVELLNSDQHKWLTEIQPSYKPLVCKCSCQHFFPCYQAAVLPPSPFTLPSSASLAFFFFQLMTKWKWKPAKRFSPLPLLLLLLLPLPDWRACWIRDERRVWWLLLQEATCSLLPVSSTTAETYSCPFTSVLLKSLLPVYALPHPPRPPTHTLIFVFLPPPHPLHPPQPSGLLLDGLFRFLMSLYLALQLRGGCFVSTLSSISPVTSDIFPPICHICFLSFLFQPLLQPPTAASCIKEIYADILNALVEDAGEANRLVSR